jgi:hypothetical protein
LLSSFLIASCIYYGDDEIITVTVVIVTVGIARKEPMSKDPSDG